MFLFLPQFTTVLYLLITMATVAFQTPPSAPPPAQKKGQESCWAHIILHASSRTTAKHYCSECITFLFISFLSVSITKVLAQILSALMTGAHLQELEMTSTTSSTGLSKWGDVLSALKMARAHQMRSTTDNSTLQVLHFPRHFQEQPPVAESHLEPDRSRCEGQRSHLQRVWSAWQHLPSLCLSFLICELEIMPPSLQDHWGH